jgi:hypothetical protein
MVDFEIDLGSCQFVSIVAYVKPLKAWHLPMSTLMVDAECFSGPHLIDGHKHY